MSFYYLLCTYHLLLLNTMQMLKNKIGHSAKNLIMGGLYNVVELGEGGFVTNGATLGCIVSLKHKSLVLVLKRAQVENHE